MASLALATSIKAAPDEGGAGREPIPGEERLIELYREFSDTVVKVKIATKSVDKNGKEQVALTVQSGFYIDAAGTVLTNAVPMQEGPRIRIEKDGVQLLAVPLASDSRTNIALIQVAKPPATISYVDVGQAPHSPPIGSLAYAITSPLDLAPTPKLGMVSGRESSFSEIEFPCTYTRIAIASGPAEGGSPVFSSKGKLIGISVASLPDVNSCYVVPTRALQHILAQLRARKEIDHPSIRAKVIERSDPTTLARSLVVKQVESGSAAARSGLEEGDQILSLQDKEISRINDWRDALFLSETGSFVSLVVRRGEAEKQIALLLEPQ